MSDLGYLETCCWLDFGDCRYCVGQGCACACHLERPRDLAGLLAFMTERGSSVTLNWGEDTEQWEVAWIVGGVRYMGVDVDAYAAARRAVHRVEQQTHA